MNADTGQPLEWWWKRSHECLARWNLRDAPLWNAGQISVGTFAEGGWYVDHGGFGCRGFSDKAAAWRAVRRLMALHEGRWEQAPGDSERQSPLRFNGSRTIRSEAGNDMYSHWGILQEERWDAYSAAIAAGTRLRYSQEHPALGGYMALTEYVDPFDGSTRFAAEDQHDGVNDTTDYLYRNRADRQYVGDVWSHATRRFPYVSSDVPKVPTDAHPVVQYGEGGSIVLYDGWAEYDR